MPIYRTYEECSFTATSRAHIEQADDIIEEYAADGYDLTLRQLYYQFVARGLIPNTKRSYKNMVNLISRARRAGQLPWDAIVDRTRRLESLSHWDSPQDIIEAASETYRIDTRCDQHIHVEVWVEKEALAGVIQRASEDHDVSWFSCRGYPSDSAMWRAGQRLKGKLKLHGCVVILHLGDHDPSGIDMTRDISDRLDMFIFGGSNPTKAPASALKVQRIALNMAQVKKYSPPPNPAKLSDTRGAGYIEKYGTHCWELDALAPKTLTDLIDAHIGSFTVKGRRCERLSTQANDRIELALIAENYDAALDGAKEALNK